MSYSKSLMLCALVSSALLAANAHAFTFKDGFKEPNNYPGLRSVSAIERFIAQNQAEVTIRYRHDPNLVHEFKCIPIEVAGHAREALFEIRRKSKIASERESLNRKDAMIIINSCTYASGKRTYVYP